ncbi:MAG: EVE domain-containing protein [Planctomycetes bacterium]|nr:EVE domain-containing protein [Planctomycetota bacterium]
MVILTRQRNGRVHSIVLRRIRREHVEQALDALDAGITHAFGPSTDYDLLARGRVYAPKAVFGVAAQFALGQQLVPDDFSGGENSTCFSVLRDCGYTVEPKPGTVRPASSSRTWIFQGNPDTFDLDGYLARKPARISWAVNQHRDEIRVGDRVFLWRSAGKHHKSVAGIIARCTVDSEPWQGPLDPAGHDLWRGEAPPADGWHVWLQVDEQANERRVLKREWLKSDPVCRNLLIVKQAAGTNYAVSQACLDRLEGLWERTGKDWTRPECIAALWAYDASYQREVSSSDGSPVAEVALRIGRAVAGVYNKLMNFRALDPRDERKGLDAGGAVDEEVWSEFYDPSREVLRSDDLQRSYLDLWGDTAPAGEEAAPTLPSGPPPVANANPGRASQTTYRVVRDSAVTRWVKEVHGHRCQACGERFDSPKGPVAEGAHIRPLGAVHEGPDDTRNVICLCPTHHALFDRGGFVVLDDLSLHSTHVDGLLDRLVTQTVHEVATEFLRYHRKVIARWSGAEHVDAQ